MPISVASPANRPGLATALAAVVRAALAIEGRRPGQIAIVLTHDAELRDLNRRWRGIDRATDVLSFPYTRDDRSVDGDLVISLDRLAAQAKRYRVTAGKELARLVVHGTLHLCGLDHHREAERRQMRRREAAAMRACAVRVAAIDRALGRVRHG